MLSLFKKLPVFIRLQSNEILVANLETDASISRKAETPFSSERQVLSDLEPAEKLIRSMFKELGIGGKFLNRPLKALIQQAGGVTEELTPVDKRALRDLAETCGAKEVYIVTHTHPLTPTDANTFWQEAWPS